MRISRRLTARRIRTHMRRYKVIDSYFKPLDRGRHISAIERSPLLDQEFYELQSGQTFRTRRDAVAHFYDIGLDAGYSITPLFQDEWYRFHTSRSGTGSFLSFFFAGEALNTTSPFFDARLYAEQCAAARRPVPTSVRTAMERFVTESTAMTPLPTPPWAVGQPTFGEARALAFDATRANHAREHLVRPRLSDEWDADLSLWSKDVDIRPDLLVSAIMPVRNRAGMIPDAIRSVLAQSHPNWELIIVDDGSTDDTVEVVKSFAATDSRIRLVTQPPSGVCLARNAGLDQANGEFVTFIDSDNEWLPDFIALSLPSFDDPTIVATHAAVEMANEHGEFTYLAVSGDRDDLISGGNFIDLNTLMARRSSVVEVGGFDPSLRRWVDFDLVIRLSDLGELHFVPFIGVAYSHRGDVKRISTVEPNGWEQVVLTKYLLDWPALELASTTRTPGLVSIVMLTYADWRMTVDAVQSVLNNSGDVPFELVVIDNGSPRSVREILTASLHGDERIRLVSQPRNTNFSLGSNLGFAETRGEFVVFLNDDVLVEPNWLAPLIAPLVANPTLSGTQSVVRNPSGEIESSGLDINPSDGLPHNVTVDPSIDVAVAALSGIACAYRATVFARMHGFDPLYSNGFEDADLALRLTEAEGTAPRFLAVPGSRVTHFSVYSPGRFLQMPANERVFTTRWERNTED